MHEAKKSKPRKSLDGFGYGLGYGAAGIDVIFEQATWFGPHSIWLWSPLNKWKCKDSTQVKMAYEDNNLINIYKEMNK